MSYPDFVLSSDFTKAVRCALGVVEDAFDAELSIGGKFIGKVIFEQETTFGVTPPQIGSLTWGEFLKLRPKDAEELPDKDNSS